MTLLDKLASLTDRPLGTVVHVGAGNGMVLERLARLSPARVVLVEGDPDIAAALERSADGLPWAEVVDRPVAAQAGPLAWHRYSLPAVNGPLDATPLGVYYPRLRRTGSRRLDAIALADLLASLDLGEDDPGAHVLVLDVPGQEDALLASLPQPLLTCFELVVLRGCREALPPDGAAADQAIARLQACSFDVLANAADTAPLWPETHLRRRTDPDPLPRGSGSVRVPSVAKFSKFGVFQTTGMAVFASRLTIFAGAFHLKTLTSFFAIT